MATRGMTFLLMLVLLGGAATPAAAKLSPYLRFDLTGSQFKMSDGNALIRRNQTEFQAAGFPASFKPIGVAYGPSGAVGLWLLPDLRVGATWTHLKAVRDNRLHVPGQLFFDDDVTLRMTEIGAEAAVRIVKLAGLTVGGSLARGKAEMVEGFSYEDYSGQLYQDATAQRTVTTWGGFVGIDQTNDIGLAGFMRVGYQVRDIGSIPSRLTISDGVNTAQGTGMTVPLDLSGVYVKIGVGYDFSH